MVRNQRIHARTGPNMLECAYGLRYVADNGNLDGRERWSFRQYAVYQKYDPSCSQVIWVFVGIPKESGIEQHVMDHIRKYPFTNSMHSFALHLTLIEASIVAWRWYLNDMTERVQDQVRKFQVFLTREAYHQQSDRITLADVAKDKIDGLPEFNIDFRDRQRLKTLEDAILNLEIMLSSTISTISCLMGSLSKPMGQQNGDSWTEETLSNGFSEILNETKLYLTKAQVLEKRIQGASALLSGLLDYENAYSLRLLAEEARNDNTAMRNLTEKATKDSSAIKIITIITVFFLPATVVASFFSTQFVSISTNNLVLSTKWWIYFAITGPLTILTLLVWYITSSTHVQNAVLHRLRKARLIRGLATDIPRINSERASSVKSRTLGIPG
jgi:Mg2+ and Co2+ transporter CorA